MTDSQDDTPNEIVAAAQAQARGEAAAKKAANGRQTWPLAKIGLAAGIGSAAIAGAVLFAQRGRGTK